MVKTGDKEDILLKKVYADNSNQAMIVCPSCGFTKKIDVKKFRNTHKRVKVKCKCNETFLLFIEFRKHYRKKVRLIGEYAIKEKEQKGNIIIRDLSMNGIRFETLRPHQISVNDVLELKFILDDSQKLEIRKLVTVKWVRDRIIGVQYSETNLYKKELGFYMKS